MKYFGIYCFTVLPLVLHVCCDNSVPMLDEGLKITNCSDCKKFPGSSSGFATILKKNNTPIILVGASDGVLKMTMDGQLIHNTSIPSRRRDKINCLHDMKMGSSDERGCSNIISGLYPQKQNGYIFACGSNSNQSPLCWNASETSVVGSPKTNAFYTVPERKYVISDPYIFQGYTFPDNKLSGELIRVNIYAPVGSPNSKYTLRLNDYAPRFVNVYEFGNYIYYFFIEQSEENIKASSKVTYARVGRLCKYDKGGNAKAPATFYFHTFSKARLLCPVTTDGQVVQFNNLELTSAITGDNGEVYIYGLFRAAKPVDSMFAICRYSLSKIEKAFESKKYYVRSDTTINTVVVGNEDLRHKKCDKSLHTQSASYEWYKQYKTRLLHLSVVTPDAGKPVIVRDHGKITSMFAKNVMIASKSYDILRLFDPNFMYELFVPVNFFQEKNGKTFLSKRKISEESLTIRDVTEMKYDGAGSPVSSSTGLPKAATTVASKHDVSTTPKPLTTTQRPPTTSSSSTPTNGNSTASNQTVPGNMSTTNPQPTSGHVPSTVLSLTNEPSGITTTPDPQTDPTPSKASTSTSSSATPTISWDSFVGQVKIIVAAMERLVFVPLASCGAHTTCRDCVAIKNPYCAWQNGKCVQLNATGNGVYKQDIENGDYSKLCPPVDVTCNVQASKMIPKAEFTLQCNSSGLPDPSVFRWSKDGKKLKRNSKEELKIQSYTLETAGKYTCHVSNNVTSNSCSVEIQGSKPKIDCKVTRFVLSCNVSGYPQPEMVLEKKRPQAEKKQETAPTEVLIEKNIEYEFIAFNGFGLDSGGVYKLISKLLEFKIKGGKWSKELLNKRSQEYTQLKNRVKKAVIQLYKNNTSFHSVDVTFRKGSVIAAVEITGLKTPTSNDSVLTDPLEEAIKNKALGDLVAQDQQSTPAPTKTPSTREVSSPPSGKQTSLPTSFPSTRLPASTRLPTTHKSIFDTRPVETLGTKPAVAQKLELSSGVPVWLLIVLLILIGLLVFCIAYFCGVRRFCKKFYSRSRECTKDSSGCSEEDVEMKGMSRNEKGRESERMLLKKHEGKKQSPSKKSSPKKKTNHDGTNNVSKHGSVEIKQTYDSEEDHRPVEL